MSNILIYTKGQPKFAKVIRSSPIRGTVFPGTWDWVAPDSEELFLSQPVEHQDYWNSQPPIKYNLNSYGFRCDELQSDIPSICFLGCSMTFGIGVRKEDSFSYKLAKELGLKEYNLGVPGGSLDSAFRLYNEWQPIIKSKITVCCIPPGNRFEVADGFGFQSSGVWSIKVYENKKKSDLSKFFLQQMGDDISIVNKERNLSAIKYIASLFGSKLYIYDIAKADFKKDEGRDKNHPGPSWHHQVKEYIINEIRRDAETSNS